MSLSSIVLHVGFPKTGTTTLQNKLAKEVYYAGTESDSEHITKDLLRLFYSHTRGKDIRQRLDKWMVTTSCWAMKRSIKTVILSNEHFLSGELNGVDEFPFYIMNGSQETPQIIDFLNYLKNVCNERRIDLKCIVTIRNQYEWVASKYAQGARAIYNATQDSFESHLKEFSREGDSYWCDWFAWVEQLLTVFPSDDLCVLCLEDIRRKSFWDDISNISCLECSDLMKDESDESSHMNIKRMKDGSWVIGGFNPMAYILKSLKFFPSSERQKVINKCGAIIHRLGLYGIRSKKSIHLSEESMKYIYDSCSQGNKKLADLTGKDLEGMGYPVF